MKENVQVAAVEAEAYNCDLKFEKSNDLNGTVNRARLYKGYSSSKVRARQPLML